MAATLLKPLRRSPPGLGSPAVPDVTSEMFPVRHAMRLVDLEIERTADGDVRGWMPVTDHVRSPSGGPRLGPVAMLVDALGGARSLPAAAPDWSITADMSLHLVPVGAVTELAAAVHVRRRGRRTLVVDVDLTADGGRPAGLATVSFAVVPRPAHLEDVVVDLVTGRRPMIDREGAEPLDRAYVDELGISGPAPGTTAIELRREVTNNLGALHGAVHAAMIDEASASLGRHLLGEGAETTEVHLAFLELARPGPLRAEATVIGAPDPAGDRLSAEVRLLDGDGRLCSLATTAVVRS